MMRMSLERKAASSSTASSNVGLVLETGDRSPHADRAGSDGSTSRGEDGYWDAPGDGGGRPKSGERLGVGLVDEGRADDASPRRLSGKRLSNARSPVPASRV